MNNVRMSALAAICSLTAAMLLVITPATAQMITSFETPEQVAMLSPAGLQAKQVPQHATEGKFSLRVDVKGSDTDTWPGLAYTPSSRDLSGCAIIAYDVFVEGQSPVAISCRIDDASGKSVFLSSNANPGKNSIELWLASRRFEIDLRNITKIYPYFSKPRRDVVLYFDNFRCQAMAARFKPIVFEETNPALEPTAADQARGYMLFARHWLSSVFPNSLPLSTELEPRLAVFGTPGQTVPVTFCIRALQDLGEVGAVSVGLKQGTKTLPAETMKINPVSYRDKRLVYSSDYFIKDMPTIIEQRATVAVPANRTQLFWASVTIPQSAAAGLYEGSVVVSAANGKQSSIPLQVRVLPYKLQEARYMLWGEYYLRPALDKTPEAKRAAVERDLADQRAHGMTSVGLCFGMEKGDYKVEGTKVTVNPDPNGLYSHFMETYKKLGFPTPVIQLSDDGQSAAGVFKLGSPEWAETYKNFWIAVAALHKERGWPEMIVQPVDEPGWQGPDERSRNLLCLKTLKEIPGQRTEQDGPGDAYFLLEAGPYADVWNFNGALEEDSIIKKAQSQGKIVTSYNNDVESYRPEMGRYCNGFYQLRAGGRGTYNWAYISFAGNPYDDQDAETGSWMHVYLPMPEIGEVGGPSTGWEGARAGVDDYNYANTLQRAIERGLKSRSPRARAAAKAGQATLDQVLSSIEYNFRTRGTAAFASEKPAADGSKRVFGALKVPNGWDFETYDRSRWQLAAATMDIMAALGETAATPARKPTAAMPAGALMQEPHWSLRPADKIGNLGGQKQVSIPILETAPVCDGDLSDPVWQKAAKLGDFTMMDGRNKPSQQTRVSVCTDGKTLYFGVECLEENIANITARIAEDGGPVWNDDDIEIFIDPTLQRSSFLQICINSLGKVFWSHPTDKTWRPAVERGARVDKPGKRWFVELGIPMSSLGLTSNVFGLNVARERRPLESLELSSWSPTGQGFGVPSRFGVASIGGSYIGDFAIGRGVMGSNDLTVEVRNDDTKSHKFLTILDWKQGKRVTLYRQKGPLELQPGASAKVELPYELVSDKEPVAVGVTLKDAETGAVYAQRRLEQQPLPVLKATFKPHVYFLGDRFGQLQADVNLSPALQDDATLMVALFDSKNNLLRKQTLPVENERLDTAVDLSGLKVGTYRLECAVKVGPEENARRLATVKTTLTKVAGPFD